MFIASTAQELYEPNVSQYMNQRSVTQGRASITVLHPEGITKCYVLCCVVRRPGSAKYPKVVDSVFWNQFVDSVFSSTKKNGFSGFSLPQPRILDSI